MSGIINFNAQIAPMEHVEKVVRAEQEHSQVKQEALLQKASEHLSKDDRQVQKGADSKKGRRVDQRSQNEEESRRNGAAFAGKDRGAEGQASDEALTESAQTDIWSGNIVNLKV